MNNLLKEDWEKKYLDYISSLHFEDEELKTDFIECLKDRTPIGRKEKWNSIRIRLSNISEAKKFSNPYYIGFGNPKSEILFIGKEKAFDLCKSTDLFFKESIDNTYQWKNLNNQIEPINHTKFFNEFGFNPQFPTMENYGNIKKRGTWGMYAEIVSKLYALNADDIRNTDKNSFKNSFYNYCFSTEINFIPSKYSNNKKLINIREPLLQNEFYKGFSKIIIGAKSSVSQEKVSSLFKLDGEFNEEDLGEIGKKRKRMQKIFKWKKGSQTVIICDQLSGAAGWSDKTLNCLIKHIKH